MADHAIIAAEPRREAGTGAARAVRRAGKVPGIVYGPGRDNVMVQLDRDALAREAGRAGFFNHLYKLKLGTEGEPDAAIDVLPRDLQLHPVTDLILHVDFLAVEADARITVAVPVRFAREEACPGLRRGGVLNVVRHEVEVHCPAAAIPEEILIDLTGLDIGDSIHISTVALGEEVSPVIDERDFTIATIAPPTVAADLADAEEAEEDEAIEPAEGAAETRPDEGS